MTWILFLRILDAQESRSREEAEAVGADFSPALLHSPYRLQDWAAPWSDKEEHPKTDEGKPFGWKRQDIDTLKHDTFFGREKENLVFPIALANLVLHGIDQPNLWHGNTLTGRATYGALFEQAPLCAAICSGSADHDVRNG